MPTTGMPIVSARSITLTIFSANASPSDPPNTVKSWEKMATGRPSTVPQPVTTPSPQGPGTVQSEVGRAVALEGIQLGEAAGVEQGEDALAGAALATLGLLGGGGGVLGVDGGASRRWRSVGPRWGVRIGHGGHCIGVAVMGGGGRRGGGPCREP
jgi:hypothetical protein